MAVIIDGTAGETFSGTGMRITGDFSNATIANRVMFQTSTANGATSVYIIPNGTSLVSQFVAVNNSDPTNAGILQAQANSTDIQFRAGITGTGTYLPMTFYTGGSERMRVDTSGNVGIGTNSPSSYGQFVVYSATTGVVRAYGGAVGAYLFASSGGGLGAVGTETNNAFALYTNGSERARFDTSGNVGIGTSSPADVLQAVKSTASGTYRTRFILDNQDQRSVIASYYQAGVAQRMVIQSTAVTGTVAIPIAFETGNTEAMRIDGSGNVGIGAVSSGQRLWVETSASTYALAFFRQSAAATVADGVVFDCTNTPATYVADFRLGNVSQFRVNASGQALVTAATGLGYGTGSGGTVTQATSKSTAVTLNKPTGQITMNNASLAANTPVAFTFNNSLISATDNVVVSIQSVGSASYVSGVVSVGTGLATLMLWNITAGARAEAVVLNFAVIKGATS